VIVTITRWDVTGLKIDICKKEPFCAGSVGKDLIVYLPKSIQYYLCPLTAAFEL
jgi:hypothetical protein